MKRSTTTILLPLLLAVGMGLFILTTEGCTKPHAARDALSRAGYTSIELEGWAPLLCDRDDYYATGFSATNGEGERITGAVCTKLWTGFNTIRY